MRTRSQRCSKTDKDTSKLPQSDLKAAEGKEQEGKNLRARATSSCASPDTESQSSSAVPKPLIDAVVGIFRSKTAAKRQRARDRARKLALEARKRTREAWKKTQVIRAESERKKRRMQPPQEVIEIDDNSVEQENQPTSTVVQPAWSNHPAEVSLRHRLDQEAEALAAKIKLINLLRLAAGQERQEEMYRLDQQLEIERFQELLAAQQFRGREDLLIQLLGNRAALTERELLFNRLLEESRRYNVPVPVQPSLAYTYGPTPAAASIDFYCLRAPAATSFLPSYTPRAPDMDAVVQLLASAANQAR